ncbi:MAG: TonB-dependent receptor, partial [Hymenobacter sp.]
TQSFAQSTSRSITGKIVAQNNQPISGASITIKGTQKAVAADNSGNFSIVANTGDVLVVTYVGYGSKTVKVAEGQNQYNFSLTEVAGQSDDVVVVGYGKMKRTDLSSAQTTVTAADISRTVNTTFDQALQGRAANVYVSSNSGQPGAAPSVVVRGVASLTGSIQPLYVIDGVQIQPNNPSDDPNNHPAGFANILSGISPDDIESMTVLQGPSATSIYGSKGANGVILITTKRGKSGESKITVSSLLTAQDQPNYIPVMNLPQYAAYRNEVAKAGGTASDSSFADPSVLGRGTNWQDELFRRTLLQKHNLAVSGGSEKSTFYLSGEYFNQDGISPGSGFSRASLRVNLDNQTRKWLKIGTNLSVNQTTEKVNTTNAGIISLALQQNPSIPVKNPNGTWGGPATSQFQFSNPIALATI